MDLPFTRDQLAMVVSSMITTLYRWPLRPCLSLHYSLDLFSVCFGGLAPLAPLAHITNLAQGPILR